MRCHERVLHQRHVGEKAQVLEGARNTLLDNPVRLQSGNVLTCEQYAAVIRLDEAGDKIEERRLAGAVRPNDADDRTRHDVEIDAVHGLNAAERLRQALDLKQRLARVNRAPMKGDKSGLDSISRWHRVLLLIAQRCHRGAFGNDPLAAIEHHHHKNDAENQFDRLHQIKVLQKDNAVKSPRA